MTGAELFVAGWFASPVIKNVIDKAENYLVGNYKLQKEAKKLVEILKENLAMIIATVEVSEELMIKIKDPHLSTWLKILEEAAYDAEDVLDNMGAKFIKENVHGKNKVSKFASASLNVLIPDDNHKKLKKVVDKVIRISDNISKFLELVNIQERKKSNNNDFSDQTETIYGPLNVVNFYVRKKELKLILEIMLGPNSGFNRLEKKSGSSWYWRDRQNYSNIYRGFLVIPIVGIGGVGKTALAQAVYSNRRVRRTFKAKTFPKYKCNTYFPNGFASKAWISASYNLDVKLLMHKLIHSFGGKLDLDANMITLEIISRNLFSILAKQRVLVVLDDMCEKIEHQWDDLYTTLSQGAPGSVVLITTQNQAFANRVGTFGHIELTPLEQGAFSKLFKHFAFGNIDIPMEKKKLLEEIGTEIALKLHGLPLEAKIIGNTLSRNIDNLHEWMRICRSQWWEMPDDEDRDKILPYIGVGYQHLNPSLRKCFAYCSLFPRNSPIERDTLVQMWIAQNFIPHDGNGAWEMEDVGRKWFDKLVAMSVFQPTVDNEGYVMPSLMHDLAVIVSSGECFFLNDRSQEISGSVRHLAVDRIDKEVAKKIRKHKKLRSFLYFGFNQVERIDTTINNTLRKLHRIRVLDLSYLHMETKKPPAAIQHMPHLRFLNLSSTGIKELTHSRFNHYHLQSLHIQKCQLISLPKCINKLIRIRHLNANAETIAMISGIGQLVDLQELDEYRVEIKEGHKITELKNLGSLTGQLKIKHCANIKSRDEAEQAKLADKKKLHSVKICWNSAQREAEIDKEILEALKPYKYIKELAIEGYLGSSFPHWMSEMSHFLNLQTLCLISCINIEVLPFLGKYPLYTLEIVDNLSLREAPLHSYSESLKVLKIRHCHNLNSLGESLSHLTKLSVLHIINCKVCGSLNINDLLLLEDLELRDCPNLNIRGDLQSHGNLKSFKITRCPLAFSFPCVN